MSTSRLVPHYTEWETSKSEVIPMLPEALVQRIRARGESSNISVRLETDSDSTITTLVSEHTKNPLETDAAKLIEVIDDYFSERTFLKQSETADVVLAALKAKQPVNPTDLMRVIDDVKLPGISTLAEDLSTVVKTHNADRVQQRKNIMNNPALDMNAIIRAQHKAAGIQIHPDREGQNLSLWAVEEFRTHAKSAQSLRDYLREMASSNSVSPEDISKLALAYAKEKQMMQGFLDYGVVFEKAYREYIKHTLKLAEFDALGLEYRGLLLDLQKSPLPVNKDVEATKGKVHSQSKSREHAAIVASHLSNDTVSTSVVEEYKRTQAELMASVFPPDSQEYQDIMAKLGQVTEVTPTKSIAEIRARMDEILKQRAEIFKSKFVRKLFYQRQQEKYTRDLEEGKSTLETQSVIKYSNMLSKNLFEARESVIGGTLVGPPGVGKTTLIRHFYEKRGQQYLYMDMSEEVTRYTYFGMRAVEFQRPSEVSKAILQEIDGMDEQGLTRFVQTAADRLKAAGAAAGDMALVSSLGMLGSHLEEAANSKDLDEPTKAAALKAKDALLNVAKTAYNKALGDEYFHLIAKNGWKNGIILSAIEKDMPVILDEFPQARDYHSLHSVMEARPDHQWYCEANGTWYPVGKNFKLWFTGNIGSRYGSKVPHQAMVNRLHGRVMEIDYPPLLEEEEVLVAALSDRQRRFLRSNEDRQLLRLFLKDVVGHPGSSPSDDLHKGIRDFAEESKLAAPFSWRTILDITNKLVTRKDADGLPVYGATDKTVNQALVEAVLDPYEIFPDKKYQKLIAQKMLSCGLLLSPEVEDRVKSMVDPDFYANAKANISQDALKKRLNDVDNTFKAMALERDSAPAVRS